MATAEQTALRWETLRYHETQASYWQSPSRFNLVHSGRRSGKTELAKRKIVIAALRGTKYPAPRFFCAAPTHDQAKAIFWHDLKLLIPGNFIYSIHETERLIYLVNTAQIRVVGMDRPERIEGVPWDGGILDEFGNMKPQTWAEHIRPALSDRHGWCDFIGVPEGRNHYYELAKKFKADDSGRYGIFHWHSKDILSPEEMVEAMSDMDEQTFDQEYGGEFISFLGRAYYPFEEKIHANVPLKYDPKAPLILMFDFNVDPGVAAVGQEQKLPSGQTGTGIIKEVYIPRNSNTIRVAEKIKQDWAPHTGKVICYGDPTGGNRHSTAVRGTDWDLIEQVLRPVFGNRFEIRVRRKAPPERDRVNAVNSRLKSVDGSIRLMVDPKKAPRTVIDFEGVRLIEGGTGEINKKDLTLTHLTDAIGYYIHREFPLKTRKTVVRGV